MTLRLNRLQRTSSGHADTGLVSRNAIPPGAKRSVSHGGREVFDFGNERYEETMPRTGVFRKLVRDPGKQGPL